MGVFALVWTVGWCWALDSLSPQGTEVYPSTLQRMWPLLVPSVLMAIAGFFGLIKCALEMWVVVRPQVGHGFEVAAPNASEVTVSRDG